MNIASETPIMIGGRSNRVIYYSHELCSPGLECMTTFVPGGANGVRLKSNSPKRWVYDERFSFNMMRVMKDWDNNLSYSLIEKSGWSDDNPT